MSTETKYVIIDRRGAETLLKRRSRRAGSGLGAAGLGGAAAAAGIAATTAARGAAGEMLGKPDAGDRE